MRMFCSMRFLLLSLVALATFGLTPASFAQERSATGTLDSEANWSTLLNSFNKTNMVTQTIEARLNQSAKCAAKGRTYAPGMPNTDVEACLAPFSLNDLMKNFVACGDQGLIYSTEQNKCLSTIEKVQVCSMRTTTITSNMSYGNKCPAGYSSMGTVFSHYKKPAFKDGCETCNPIYVTTCATMVCEYK